MASHYHIQKSVQHSRVSSSSSSHNQSYELIPRDEPFSNPNRDLPSPRASFPFKKVQGGIETSIGKKNQNDSRGNVIQQKKQEKVEKELIQVIKLVSSDKNIPKSIDDNDPYEIMNKNANQKLQAEIQRLSAKITEFQENQMKEREEFKLEKQVNQIYSEAFAKIREILIKKKVTLEGESVEQIVQKLQELLNKKREQSNLSQLLEQQDTKIRQLRAQLLKSSQNNINAIFNTEITEAQCLHLQIKKMNGQIFSLKENILKINSQNKIDANYFYQNAVNPMKQHKTVNIYHHSKVFDSSDDEEFYQKGRKRKQTFSKSKRSRDSGDRSESDSHKKSRRLTNTQLKVGQLIEGYKLLREEYRSLQQTIKQLNHNQSDYKLFFNSLKAEIQTSIKNQIKQVKETIKRPSSNLEQRKIAKDLEGKLNHLINTLNAPEKASTQKSLDEENNLQRPSQEYQKLLELQAHNYRLEKQKKKLEDQKQGLELKVIQMESKSYKFKEGGVNELHQDSIEGAKRKAGRKHQFQQFINGSRSDLKQEEIMQQFSGNQNNSPVIHPSSLNKLHSSQSYHQSNNKSSEIEHLHRKLQVFQEAIRQKEIRITELQNTIIDHFQSKAVIGQPITITQLRQKYEIYTNNLKILLSEAKKENEILRKEFIKINQLNLSRANQDQERNSLTLSSRTTKNPLAQTRLIQRKQAKPNSNYQLIQLKLKIEDQIEKIFLAFLELYQQSFELVEEDRRGIGSSIMNCIKFLVDDARSKKNRLFEQTIERQQVKKILNNLGFYQK